MWERQNQKLLCSEKRFILRQKLGNYTCLIGIFLSFSHFFIFFFYFNLNASISYSRLSTQRRIKSNAKYLTWSSLQKYLTASCYCFISSAKTDSQFLLKFDNFNKIYVTLSTTWFYIKAKYNCFTSPPPRLWHFNSFKSHLFRQRMFITRQLKYFDIWCFILVFV